jgi:hypothetical protein
MTTRTSTDETWGTELASRENNGGLEFGRRGPEPEVLPDAA